MYLSGAETPQLHDGALGVPQRGGIGGGDHHHAVRRRGGQGEALSQPGGRVDQAVVVPLPDLVGQGAHGLHGEPAPHRGQRRGQQRQLGVFPVGRRGFLQGAAALQHIGEIHGGAVRQAQRQIQIPQRNVAVQRQCGIAHGGQRQRYAGGE